MSRHRTIRCALPLLMALICAASSQADVITPAGVTASSSFGPDQAVAHLIDGSGLTVASPIETSVHGNGGGAGGGSGFFWHSEIGDLAPNIDFDLGGAFDLQSLVLWNFNVSFQGELNRGINSFNVIASGDSVFGNGDDLNFNGLTALVASGLDTEAGQVFDMPGANGVQFVRIDVQSNHGSTVVTGLSEVRFVDVVPEPTSAVMASVVGSIGFIALRFCKRGR